MTVDISKIRVGDEIEVHHEVVDLTPEGRPLYLAAKTKILPAQESIVRHIPAARPIEVGDVVSLGGSNHGKVLAIENGKAWVTVAGTHAYPHALNNLTRIDNPDRSVSL